MVRLTRDGSGGVEPLELDGSVVRGERVARLSGPRDAHDSMGEGINRIMSTSYLTAPAVSPPISRFSMKPNMMITGTIATIETVKTYCQFWV